MNDFNVSKKMTLPLLATLALFASREAVAAQNLPREFAGYSLGTVVTSEDDCIKIAYTGKNLGNEGKFSDVKCITDSNDKVWAVKAHYSETISKAMSFGQLADSLSKKFGAATRRSHKASECDFELSFAMMGSGKFQCAVWDSPKTKLVLIEDVTDARSSGQGIYRYFAITTIDKALRAALENKIQAGERAEKQSQEDKAKKLLNEN